MIFCIILSEKYKAINESNDIKQYNIDRRFKQVYHHISESTKDEYEFYEENSPQTIISKWQAFDKAFDGAVTSLNKMHYGVVVKTTLKFLEYIRQIPITRGKSKVDDTRVRTTSLEEEKQKFTDIEKKRAKLLSDLEKLKLQEPKPIDKIKALSAQLEQLENSYKKSMEVIKELSSEATAEETVSHRIDDAFADLTQYTSILETERKRIKKEYWTFFVAIPLLTIGFIYLYYHFLNRVYLFPNNFTKLIDFLPYTAMVPIYIGLVWVSVYLKNRADKISIEISNKLFGIHYLEGLMLMTNKLSTNTAEAVVTINRAINSLLDNYLSQINRSNLSEVEISKMEATELEKNPYWKVLLEIKNLIKTIKS